MITVMRNDGVLITTKQYPQSMGDKPNGLWMCSDTEWILKCYLEMPDMINNSVIRILEIKEDANILELNNLEEMIAFTEEYGKSSQFYRKCENIDWEAVTKRYDGVSIEWTKDAHFSREIKWFWSWDVSSTCIWNIEKAIE